MSAKRSPTRALTEFARPFGSRGGQRPRPLDLLLLEGTAPETARAVIEEVVREVAPDAASMDIDLISDLPWPSDAQAAVRMSRPPMENARSTPSSSSTAIHFMDLPPELRKVFDAFGRDRIFRGPDLTRLPCIHHECVKHFAHSLLFLSGRDRARVMVEALLDWTERPA